MTIPNKIERDIDEDSWEIVDRRDLSNSPGRDDELVIHETEYDGMVIIRREFREDGEETSSYKYVVAGETAKEKLTGNKDEEECYHPARVTFWLEDYGDTIVDCALCGKNMHVG